MKTSTTKLFIWTLICVLLITVCGRFLKTFVLYTHLTNNISQATSVGNEKFLGDDGNLYPNWIREGYSDRYNNAIVEKSRFIAENDTAQFFSVANDTLTGAIAAIVLIILCSFLFLFSVIRLFDIALIIIKRCRFLLKKKSKFRRAA